MSVLRALRGAVLATLARTPRLRALLKRIYRRLQPDVRRHMARALPDKQRLVFVVVGANDGVKSDPLARMVAADKRWRGLLIEPVPHIFARLRQNYADTTRFACENVAIAPTAGRLPFYYVSPDAAQRWAGPLPAYADQVGSFRREHLVEVLGQDAEPLIVAEPVPCEPLESVMQRNGIDEVDLLQIDTEGFDYEVLKQVDFQKHAVGMILYEHMHLSPQEQAAARNLLAEAGYDLFTYQGDTLATRRGTQSKRPAR